MYAKMLTPFVSRDLTRDDENKCWLVFCDLHVYIS